MGEILYKFIPKENRLVANFFKHQGVPFFQSFWGTTRWAEYEDIKLMK